MRRFILFVFLLSLSSFAAWEIFDKTPVQGNLLEAAELAPKMGQDGSAALKINGLAKATQYGYSYIWEKVEPGQQYGISFATLPSNNFQGSAMLVVNFAKDKQTSCIMCHEQPSIEKLQRTGVVELDGQMKVLGMEEKPQVPKSHWAVPPFYIYLKKDLDLVRHSVENGCGKDAPGNLAHYMVEHTTMHAWPMSAGRFDIGSLDTYYEAVEKCGK